MNMDDSDEDIHRNRGKNGGPGGFAFARKDNYHVGEKCRGGL